MKLLFKVFTVVCVLLSISPTYCFSDSNPYENQVLRGLRLELWYSGVIINETNVKKEKAQGKRPKVHKELPEELIRAMEMQLAQ